MDIDPDQVLTKTFSAGQLLFSEGEQPQFAYFLIKGSGHSYLVNDNGETFITNKYLSGSFIGYMAILEQTAHQDNSAVIEDSSVLLIPRHIFIQLLSYDNMVAKQFVRLLAGNDLDKQERIRKYNAGIERFPLREDHRPQSGGDYYPAREKTSRCLLNPIINIANGRSILQHRFGHLFPPGIEICLAYPQLNKKLILVKGLFSTSKARRFVTRRYHRGIPLYF